MRILIVDDSKAMRLIVTRTLRQAGFDKHSFEEAVNGADALRVCKATPPDVVLSDWNMPEMNGIDLLRALKAAGYKGKFAFVTSESSPEMRVQATEAGAQVFVTKPFTPEAFRDALAPVLR